MIETKMEEARKILKDLGWSKRALGATFHPTPEQAADRAFIPAAEVNPEQQGALFILHAMGWGVHDIAAALPVPEAEVLEALNLGWTLEELLDEDA